MLGLLAVVLAVPAAAGAYTALVASPLLESAWAVRDAAGAGAGASGTLVAGLDARAVTTLVVAVSAAVLVQVAVAVWTAARSATVSGGPARRRTVARGAARSGADVLLVALAALGVVQLAAHHPGDQRIDPVLVVAPVLGVAAVAVLSLRVLPLVARVLELRAHRSTGLAGPVAAWRVARGRASAGVLLVVLAAVVTTFGVSWGATWWVSQQDQADASVGPDVVVPADGRIAEGARLAGEVPVVRLAMPVAHRTVALGSRPGGLPLVAFDATRADDVVRGRLPGGGTWTSRLAPLVPGSPRDGLAVTGTSVPLEVRGTVEQPASLPDGGLVVSADLSVVLEDEQGARTTVPVASLPLDGTTLRTRIVAPDGSDLPEGRWTAVAADVVLHTTGDAPFGLDDDVPITITLRVPGAEKAVPGATWTARATEEQTTRRAPAATREGDTLTLDLHMSLFMMVFTSVGVEAMGFQPDEALPIALPAGLAHEAGLRVGDPATVATGEKTLPAVVAAVVPYVPGAVGDAAVLADSDSLSRALVAAGALDGAVDEWWLATDGPWPADVAGITPTAVRAEVADDLRSGPLRAALPAALVLLVAAAVLLAVAGSAAHASAGAREHDRQTVRLRVLGAPRRTLGAGSVVQHALLVAVAVAMGVALGAGLAWLLLPLVITGADGGAAQPAPLPVWPWAFEGPAIAALVAGAVAAGLPAARSVVRGSAALGPSLREES